MSLVHQKLYQSENVALIDIKAYICELVDYLQESFDTAHRIRFALDIASIEMDVAQAVPLGLILNEAISNAMKYAFPDSKNGVITVSMQPSREGYYLLTVADNGVGLPPDFNVSKGSALGMNLIHGLSKQLGGIVDIKSKDGVVIRIEFLKEKIMTSDAIPTGFDNTYLYD
jgi:two-component system, sensor histidine kinase PdtaS